MQHGCIIMSHNSKNTMETGITRNHLHRCFQESALGLLFTRCALGTLMI